MKKWKGQLNVTLHSVPVTHPGELEPAFAMIQRERANAMIVSGDLILQVHLAGSAPHDVPEPGTGEEWRPSRV
jgi:hypothetical protein